jgi:hypothetical protein
LRVVEALQGLILRIMSTKPLDAVLSTSGDDNPEMASTSSSTTCPARRGREQDRPTSVF